MADSDSPPFHSCLVNRSNGIEVIGLASGKHSIAIVNRGPSLMGYGCFDGPMKVCFTSY